MYEGELFHLKFDSKTLLWYYRESAIPWHCLEVQKGDSQHAAIHMDEPGHYVSGHLAPRDSTATAAFTHQTQLLADQGTNFESGSYEVRQKSRFT